MKDIKFSRFVAAVLILLAAFVGLAFFGAKSLIKGAHSPNTSSSDEGISTAAEQGGAAFETGAETRELDSSKQRELEKLEWLDQAAGIARIPIEEAMKIIARRPVESEKSAP